MADLCRLCAALRKKDVLELITVEVCQKLKECFAIDICLNGNELPKFSCSSCLGNLQQAFAFFTKIKESQESLILLFEESRNKPNGNSRGAYQKICNQNELSNCEAGNITPSKEVEENLGRDTCELYQIIDSDDENLFESIDLIGHSQDGVDIGSKLSEISEKIEIETYILKDEEPATLQENDLSNEIHEEESYHEKAYRLKPNAMEIIQDMVAATAHVQCDQIVNNDYIQIRDWKNYTWICHFCSERKISLLALLSHAGEKHHVIDFNNMRYECADCHKMCASYNKLLNHVRFRHHFDLKLRCDICDGLQENYTQLALHRESACENAEFYPWVDLCKFCGKSYYSRSATMTHERSQHNDSKWHECSQCEKQFKRITNLRAHEKIHSDSKGFTCDICDRKFRQKANLDVHLNTHTTDKVYECNICKKRYKTPISLEKHHLVHKDSKNFKCDYCIKGFRTKDEKLSHQRIHTGEKPLKCSYCERYFRFRSVLMGHINTHTGERPYSCEACGQRFANWPNMNKHLKRCRKRVGGKK